MFVRRGLLGLVVFACVAMGQNQVVGLVYTISEAFYKMGQYISELDARSAKGLVKREQVVLAPPRANYSVTEGDITTFLHHSLVSMCAEVLVKEQKCFCKDRFHDTHIFDNKTMDSQAAVGVDRLNRLVFVSYRMTATTKNWETNERSELVSYPFPDGEEKVHLGHLLHFKSIQQATEQRALQLLQDPRHRDFVLHVTGYSLGGSVTAISMPAWLDFLQRNGLRNRARFFAYSNPRPGNLAFARYLETLGVPLVRYAKKGDIVPHLPEQAMSYSQVGQEFYDPDDVLFAPTRLMRCSPAVVQDANCSLGNTNFFPPHHLLPFNKPIPFPPYCLD